MDLDTKYPLPKADFFSVFLQQKLSHSLRDSLTFMTKTFLQKYTQKLANYKILPELISQTVDLIINGGFLLFAQAHFAEFFYFLKRKSISQPNEKSKLKTSLKFKLLFLRFLTGWILPKIKKWSEEKSKDAPFTMDVPKQTRNRRRKKRIQVLKKIIKICFTALDVANFGFKIKYCVLYYFKAPNSFLNFN